MPPKQIPPPDEIPQTLWANLLTYAEKRESAASWALLGAVVTFIIGFIVFLFSIRFNPKDIESQLFGSQAMQSIAQTLDDVTKDIGTQYTQIKTHVQVGHTWINVSSSASIPTPSTPYLNGLYISSYAPSDANTTTKLFEAWAVGSQGTILYSSDTGKRWLQQTTFPTTFQFLNSIIFAPDHSQSHSSNGTFGWAVGSAFGAAGTIICTNDGGQTWRPSTLRAYLDPTPLDVSDASRDSGLDSTCPPLTIGGKDDACTLIRAANQHLNAITVTNPYVPSGERHNEYHVWAVGSGFRANGPAIWYQSVTDTEQAEQSDNEPSCASTPWRLKKIDKIENIQCIKQPVHLNSIGFHPPQESYHEEGYAVGSHLTVIKITTSESGYTLTPVLLKDLTNDNDPCDYPDLRGLHVGQRPKSWAVPYGVNVWAVGEKGLIVAADDRKYAPGWHRQLSPTRETLYAVHFTRDNIRGVAVGDAGTILMTGNSGETWSPVSGNEIHDNLRDVHIFEKDYHANCQGCIHSIWAVGTNGSIYYSPNILEDDKEAEERLENKRAKEKEKIQKWLMWEKEPQYEAPQTLESLLNQGAYKFDDDLTIKNLNIVITKLSGFASNQNLRRDTEHLLEIRTRIEELLSQKDALNDMPHHISTSIYRDNTLVGMLLAFGIPLMVFLTTSGICGMLLNIYRTNAKLAAFYRARADALLAATAVGRVDYKTFDKFAESLSPGERDVGGDGKWLERIGDLTSRIFGGKNAEASKT